MNETAKQLEGILTEKLKGKTFESYWLDIDVLRTLKECFPEDVQGKLNIARQGNSQTVYLDYGYEGGRTGICHIEVKKKKAPKEATRMSYLDPKYVYDSFSVGWSKPDVSDLEEALEEAKKNELLGKKKAYERKLSFLKLFELLKNEGYAADRIGLAYFLRAASDVAYDCKTWEMDEFKELFGSKE